MLDPSAFQYDQQAPLDLRVLSERAQDGTTVQDITFASPRGAHELRNEVAKGSS